MTVNGVTVRAESGSMGEGRQGLGIKQVSDGAQLSFTLL